MPHFHLLFMICRLCQTLFRECEARINAYVDDPASGLAGSTPKLWDA